MPLIVFILGNNCYYICMYFFVILILHIPINCLFWKCFSLWKSWKNSIIYTYIPFTHNLIINFLPPCCSLSVLFEYESLDWVEDVMPCHPEWYFACIFLVLYKDVCLHNSHTIITAKKINSSDTFLSVWIIHFFIFTL